MLFLLFSYNDFRHDSLSRCNCTPPYSAENAIAARCDLNPKDGRYPFPALGHRSHGATDMKVKHAIFVSNCRFLQFTSSRLVNSLAFVAQSGPTFDQQPPFKWSTADFRASTPHAGHPDEWRFEPIRVKWMAVNKHAEPASNSDD